jgi:hypothetical protein
MVGTVQRDPRGGCQGAHLRVTPHPTTPHFSTLTHDQQATTQTGKDQRLGVT